MPAAPAPQRLVTREIGSSLAAWPIFSRRFGEPPPVAGHHVATWLREADGRERLACYVNFIPHGEILLGGGACVDPAVLRRMPARLRQEARAQGGLYPLTLRWAMARFRGRFAALFGYCGDALAERHDRAAGFADTGHPRLLVHWLEECDEVRRARLVEEAARVGPF